MSRSVSATFREAVFAQETDEAFLVLLIIDHTDLLSPIRVTSDGVNTISGGETFIAYNFLIELPGEQDDTPPRAKLTVDNVDRVIVETLRSINSAPDVTIEVVLAGTPDVIEASFSGFKLRSANYDIQTVTGDLLIEGFAQEPFPAHIFSPADFPGLF